MVQTTSQTTSPIWEIENKGHSQSGLKLFSLVVVGRLKPSTTPLDQPLFVGFDFDKYSKFGPVLKLLFVCWVTQVQPRLKLLFCFWVT